MTKYQPLSDRLAAHDGGEWRATFADLEAVLGFPLPKMAHTHGSWWVNEGRKPHNLAWLDQGWKVGEVDRKGGSVVFRRAPPPATPAAEPAHLVAEPVVVAEGRKAPKAALIGGAMALVAGLGVLVLRAVKRRA